MHFHLPFPRHDRTAHIVVDPAACRGCGACLPACTGAVLELLPLRRHRHVHVATAAACRGCGACVQACGYGAIRLVLPAAGRT